MGSVGSFPNSELDLLTVSTQAELLEAMRDELNSESKRLLQAQKAEPRTTLARRLELKQGAERAREEACDRIEALKRLHAAELHAARQTAGREGAGTLRLDHEFDRRTDDDAVMSYQDIPWPSSNEPSLSHKSLPRAPY